jgi:nucleotide-binding universal stress UspA family protein
VYERILLAYDGSREGAIALREGAVLAKRVGAKVFILSVPPQFRGVIMAEAVYSGAMADHLEHYRGVLKQGVERLRSFGIEPVARLVGGDPAQAIGEFAVEIGADLVVVGHRRRSILERWWSGPSGAYLSDILSCSLLIARTVLSDEAFEAQMRAIAQAEA